MKHILFSSLIIFFSVLPQAIFAQNTPGADEAIFYLSPAAGSFNNGSSFSVDLKISVGSSKSVTSIKAYLNFDVSKVSVSSINTDISDFTAWWERTANNSTGKIQLQASVPAPGITGANGLIARINMQAINTGTVTITYDSVSSLILDPNDNNILNSSLSDGASLTIVTSGGDGGPGSSGGGDTSAPIISDVQPTSISTSSAVITWETNESATSQIEYGISETYGYFTLVDTSLKTSHQVTLSGLTPKTEYHFRSVSKDGSANKGMSADSIFTTLAVKVELIGDFNLDGKVNIFDFSMLLSNWGTAVAKYDLNKDNKVSIFDLSIFLSNWTK